MIIRTIERYEEAAAVRRGAMRLARRLRRERAEGALSSLQLSLLATLHHDGERTPRQLAKAERVQPQSLTRTLAALERAGLVDRRRDEHDRRQAWISLTAAGRAALRDDMAERDRWLDERLQRLSRPERAILALAAELMEGLAGDG
jgi:DNA-binding MarR family transcriptional regulator